MSVDELAGASPSWRPLIAMPATLPPAEPDWRRKEIGRRSQRRFWHFSAAWLGVLTLGSLLLWAGSWLAPPQPASLVLAGAAYQENMHLPHNLYGWQGLNDLAGLSREGSSVSFWNRRLLRLAHEPLEVRTDVAWDAGLDGLDEPTAVIFLALHGGADEEGAYLLPQDAGPSPTAKNRLRVSAVLDRLAKLPAEQHKLLVLDATQMSGNWQLGLLHNDFVRAVADLEPRIAAIDNLAVVCSSDADETSWVCQGWKRTFFANAFIEGLKGAARDADNDGRLDAWDVFAYAAADTARQVQANRGAPQHPRLFPAGELGRRRAAAMELAVAGARYTPPDPHQTPVFAPPPELLAAWQEHERLAGESPSPAVYSPQAWREYQDRLMRYEQLQCFGDAAAAGRMFNALHDLSRVIEQTRVLSLSSLSSTLAMPALAGLNVTPPQLAEQMAKSTSAKPGETAEDSLRSAAAEIWNGTPAEAAARWAKLQAAAPAAGADRQLMRLALCDRLLVRAAGEGTDGLKKACELTRLLQDPLQTRPAELHYMVMLARDLPTVEPGATAQYNDLWELVRLALDVRRQAERTAAGWQDDCYPYSEQISRWIQTPLADADALRRGGEDLIFADSSQWPQAKDKLVQAQTAYAAVAAISAKVQQALAVRDETHAKLPYFSLWLWKHNAGDGSQFQEETLVDQVEALWRHAHALTQMLEEPRYDIVDRTGPAVDGAARAMSLADRTAQVQSEFKHLESQLVQSWRELAEVDLPSVWVDADYALLVPQCDPELRLKLLTNKNRTARRLLIDTAGQQAKSHVSAAGDQSAAAKRTSQRRGRLQLAMLGLRWFDECPGENLENYDEVRHRLEVFVVEDRWWQALVKAGSQLGLRWRELPLQVERLTAQANTTQAPASRQAIQTADRLARQVNIATGGDTTGNAANPCDAWRFLLAADFLVSQAQRAWLDHWFAEDPQAEPYYRLAAQSYLSDAVRLDAGQPQLAETTRRVQADGRLAFQSLSRLDFTSQQQLVVEYRLQGGSETPPGFPVVWAQPGPDLQLQLPAAGMRCVASLQSSSHLAPRDDGLRSKPGQETGPDLTLAPLAPVGVHLAPRDGYVGTALPPVANCTLTCPLLSQVEAAPLQQPRVETSSLAMHGLFRGQRLAATTRIDLHLGADLVVRQHPLPQRASLAVRAAPEVHQQFGDGNGTIAIVLDCSGSMGPAKGNAFGPQVKFAEATAALQQVLSQLPQGVTVSVWSFGQAEGAGKTVADPELTIRHVQEPVRWTGDDKQLSSLMAKVQYPALEPWNESPIVRAMLAAKSDLVGVAGFKSLVVLTDGMDNRFAKDSQANPLKRDIPGVLREAFDGTGIVVNVVGFKVEDAEQLLARQQFQVVESLFPPGKLLTVDEAGQLTSALHAAFRQRLKYWVEDYNNDPAPGMPADGLEIGRGGANDSWYPGGLPPAAYQLRVHADRPLAAGISFNRGDLLLLRLAAANGSFEFQRLLYSQQDYPWKPWQEFSGWRLAVLQNQRAAAGAFEMLLSLEKSYTRPESTLQVIRPRDAWIELTPLDDKTPPAAIAWNAQAGYPAPVWSVASPYWPLDPASGLPAKPRLNVWWSPDQEAPAAAALDRLHDFKTLRDLTDRSLRVLGNAVHLESVRVEDHTVEVEPGSRQVQSCLVVRLTCDPASPVLARLGGLKPAGKEHRFYRDIGAYTGLFWPVTADQAEAALTSLNLISVDAFKQQAASRGYFIRMNELPAPQADDFRPRPVE